MIMSGRISQIRRLCGMAVLPEGAEKRRIRHTRSRRSRYNAGFSNKMSGRRRFIKLGGSTSLSLLLGLICTSADKREHAEKCRSGSRAGRAGSWGRARRRPLGNLCGGTGSRPLSPMPRAVDASAQPILPSSSRPPGARRRRDGEGAGEPLAMSEPGVRA